MTGRTTFQYQLRVFWMTTLIFHSIWSLQKKSHTWSCKQQELWQKLFFSEQERRYQTNCSNSPISPILLHSKCPLYFFNGLSKSYQATECISFFTRLLPFSDDSTQFLLVLVSSRNIWNHIFHLHTIWDWNPKVKEDHLDWLAKCLSFPMVNVYTFPYLQIYNGKSQTVKGLKVHTNQLPSYSATGITTSEKRIKIKELWLSFVAYLYKRRKMGIF